MEWMVCGITFFIMAAFVCCLINDIKEFVDMEKERNK